MSDKERKLEFGYWCCFCGGSGANRGLVLIDMEAEREQQWWCHLACLLERMVPIARESYAPPE